MIGRRLLLAAPAALSLPARAQVTTLDLPPTMPPLRPDDWVAPGNRRDVLVRWGDRVTFDAAPWEPRNPTADGVAGQFGWDARLAGILAPPMGADGVARLVVAVVHPEVDPLLAFPGGRDRPAVAAAMSGASLLNLERQSGRWVLVDGGFQSRRLGTSTLCRMGGPVALGGGVVGLLGPAAGTATPWGTLLLAEQDPASWLARLQDLDPRFRDGRHFGWVAEVDALDPQSVPVKRGALGRIGAQAVAATVTDDGRAVVFLADGRPMGFLYRFVSGAKAMEGEALEAGQLAVARAEGEAITWRPLGEGALMAPALAAEAAGATPFDTPAALAMDPRRQRLLLACRAGTTRGEARVDALNPRPGAHPGQIIEITGDPAGARMAARVLFLAGDASEGGRYGRDMPANSAVPRFPATLAVDARGRCWIGTDRAGRPGSAPDMAFACDLDGPGRAVPLPIHAAPRGGAIGGVAPTPEGDAALVVVRTPGAEPGASFDRPATRWPAFDNRLPPRSALVAITRNAGGAIGG
ncbi:PhoX family protein [Falsiroseomonas sp.]|uniref:PhoX family protein n=1 Tax=Falsiroseomonas sp. TaxID=2870721 RepID=UPI003F6F05E6